MKKLNTNTAVRESAEAKLLVDVIDVVVSRFHGSAADVEAAFGMYLMGRYLGWRAPYIIHSKKTVARWIEVPHAFEAHGPDATRSAGLRAPERKENFWKVVSRDITVDRDLRNRIRGLKKCLTNLDSRRTIAFNVPLKKCGGF